MEIIELLSDSSVLQDSDLYEKALITMREKAGLKFYDKALAEKYEEYTAQYIIEEDENIENNEA